MTSWDGLKRGSQRMSEQALSMPTTPLDMPGTSVEQFLAQRLTTLRHERHWTQRALAAQAHISQKQLRQMERGRQSFLTVASGTVRRLARLLGVTTDYLLGMDVLGTHGQDVPREEESHADDSA